MYIEIVNVPIKKIIGATWEKYELNENNMQVGVFDYSGSVHASSAFVRTKRLIDVSGYRRVRVKAKRLWTDRPIVLLLDSNATELGLDKDQSARVLYSYPAIEDTSNTGDLTIEINLEDYPSAKYLAIQSQHGTKTTGGMTNEEFQNALTQVELTFVK